MGADPEPNDRVIFANAHSSIAESHASRENRFRGVHPSEPKAGMVWVLLEELVGVASLLPNLRRESSERGSETRRGF
jgi:hypothetical protein